MVCLGIPSASLVLTFGSHSGRKTTIHLRVVAHADDILPIHGGWVHQGGEDMRKGDKEEMWIKNMQPASC